MNKCYVGIDVSKDTFNTYFNGVDGKYRNNRKGFQSLLKDVPINAIFTMESTGNYHYRLAVYLCKNNRLVRVFNPLYVKRYIQSLGNKAKTDKIDAMYISSYAATDKAQIDYFRVLPLKQQRARVIVSLLSGLSRLERSAGNMKYSASLVTSKNDNMLASMSSVKSICSEQESRLENELCELVGDIFPKQFQLLQTIPGIGAKTAAILLVLCKGLEPFETHKQLTSYVGLDTKIHDSGTIKGKGKISKTGNSYLRGLLFMCAFGSVRLPNTPMRKMYNRLLEKGNDKMLAFTAVSHRILKIAFGVVRSGEPYRSNKANCISLA